MTVLIIIKKILNIISKIMLNISKLSFNMWNWIYIKTLPIPEAPNKENCIDCGKNAK
jgi:hypothetical protein